MGKATQLPQRKEEAGMKPLTAKEKAQLVNKITDQVFEEMAGKDSLLRSSEADEYAQRFLNAGTQDEFDSAMDDIEEEYPFVQGMAVTQNSIKRMGDKPYVNEEGEEAKGPMVYDRKKLRAHIKDKVGDYVDEALGKVMLLSEDAHTGGDLRALKDVNLDVENVNGEEFNAAVAVAMEKYLPAATKDSVNVEAQRTGDEANGRITITWAGERGAKTMELSQFTGEPVGARKKQPKNPFKTA